MYQKSIHSVTAIFILCPCVVWAQTTWKPEVLPVELQVGYAVRVLDLSGDGKLDIAIVDSKRFIWLENPTWKVHVMHADSSAKFDNVCFAPHDIDNDGDIDFAVGRDWQFNNSDTGGEIGWLQCGDDPRASWAYELLTTEPTTHRMNWADWDADGDQELIVAPLKGRGSRAPGFDNTAIRLLLLSPPKSSGAEWKSQVIDDSLHVSHNIDVVDLDNDDRHDLLAASFEGVTWMRPAGDSIEKRRLGSGQSGTAPAIGASEVRLGHLNAGEKYIATIEPWHGDHVVVYTEPSSDVSVEHESLWTRHVLDEQLKWGHAVACANLDADPEQELVIGVRDDASTGHRSGVRIYDPVDAKNGKWNRSLIEPGQVAVEDLVVGDLDGDGDEDIVAVGRATHNAVIYWNQSQ